jgi:hypothetical protein
MGVNNELDFTRFEVPLANGINTRNDVVSNVRLECAALNVVGGRTRRDSSSFLRACAP